MITWLMRIEKIFCKYVKNFDLCILNGRIRCDSFGSITYHGRLGLSTVDYFISDQSLFQYVDHLIVKSPT